MLPSKTVYAGKATHFHYFCKKIRSNCLFMKPSVVLLLGSLLLFSCTSTKPLVKSDADITVAVNKEFSIELPANPSTGYSWKLVGQVSGSAIVQVSESFVSTAKSNMVGAGGTLQLHFKATRKGTETLRFIYIRPWEKGAPPAKTATYKIAVQ